MASLTYKMPGQGIEGYSGPRPDVTIEINHGTADPAVQLIAPGEKVRAADLMLLRLNDPGRSIGFGLVGIDGMYMVGERTFDDRAYENVEIVCAIRFSSSIRADDPNGFPVTVVMNADPTKPTEKLNILAVGKAGQ